MRNRGFTLIEMIISIAIFMIVAVVAVGSLVRIVALNRQAQTLQASVNNVSFALDSMSREIRQGSKIGCYPSYDGSSVNPNIYASAQCATGANNLIVFQTGKADPTHTCILYNAYWFNTTGVPGQYTLMKAQQTACNQNMSQANISNNAVFYPIVDDKNVVLTNYSLGVFTSAPFKYKWVLVHLAGYALKSQDQNSFDVETSISQRVND